MSDSNNNIIKTYNHTFSVLPRSQDKNYINVVSTFDYDSNFIKKDYLIEFKEGEKDQYYKDEALKQLLKEEEEGKLQKYCKKYLRDRSKNSLIANRKLAIAISASIVVVGLSVGLSVGLTKSRYSSTIVELTFKSGDESAYFSKEGEKEIKLKVDKGTKFADVKDKCCKPTLKYYTFDSWKISNSNIPDDYKFVEDTILKANYVKGTANVTFLAGGNGYGDFTEGQIDGQILSKFTKKVDLGTTYESLIKGVTKPSIYDHKDETEYEFLSWSFDGCNFISEKQLKSPIEEDTYLIAIYQKVPEGTPVRSTITFSSSGYDNGGEAYCGTFEYEEEETKTITTTSSYSISYVLNEGENITLNDIIAKAEKDPENNWYGNPVGDYGPFKRWGTINDNGDFVEFDYTKSLEKFTKYDLCAEYDITPRDVKSNDVTLRNIIKWANKGSSYLKNQYGNNLLGVTKKITFKNGDEYSLRIIAQDLGDSTNKASYSAYNASAPVALQKNPLTFQFTDVIALLKYSDTESTISTDWKTSNIYSYLNPSEPYSDNDFTINLPDYLSYSNDIKPCNKNGNDEKIFLVSSTEINDNTYNKDYLSEYINTVHSGAWLRDGSVVNDDRSTISSNVERTTPLSFFPVFCVGNDC